MPRNFLQKSFTRWLDKNIQRFNHPPCNITYKQGGIQFNLQGIITELQWFISKEDSTLYANYTESLFLKSKLSGYFKDRRNRNTLQWDWVAGRDVWEHKNEKGEYYCYWGSLSNTKKERFYQMPTDLLRPHGKCFYDIALVLYPTRLALWENECFEYVLSLSNACTKDNLWLCYLDHDIGLFPEHKLEEIRKLNHFLQTIAIHKMQLNPIK